MLLILMQRTKKKGTKEKNNNPTFMRVKIGEDVKISSSHRNESTALAGWVAQSVRALSSYAKVASSIPGQGICKKQPMNASISRTTNQFVSLSLKKERIRKNQGTKDRPKG